MEDNPLRIRGLIRTRLYDCPSNPGRSRCQTAKSGARPRPRNHNRARARGLDSRCLDSRRLDSVRLGRSSQVMFSSRRLAEGRDLPPIYLIGSSPCSGLSRPATDAHMPQQPPRRNEGAAAVRVALVRSERIAVLMQSQSI